MFATSLEKRFLIDNRKIEPYVRNNIYDLEESNIASNQQFSYVANQCGCFENYGFTRNDFYNMRRDDLRNIKLHDIDILIEKFSTLKKEDSRFYYSNVLDEKGKYNTYLFFSIYIYIYIIRI